MANIALPSHHEKNPEDIGPQEQGFAQKMTGNNQDDDPDYTNHLTPFAPVIASINLEQLSQLAVSVRKRTIAGKQYPSTSRITEDVRMTCTVLSPPLAGSYNIIFPLLFNDGVRWIFKVPMTGYKCCFNDQAAQALTSEAMTMRLIKRDTRVPVPEVYSFDASLDNEAHCPYIMMEYLQGRPLHELWFQGSSEAVQKQFRTRVLQELAAAMAQLNNLRYPKGGSLLFDQSGDVTGIGPIRVVDFVAQFDRFASEDNDGSALFCLKGPFHDVKSFMTFAIDRRDRQRSLEKVPKYYRGILQLLRLLIDWIPNNDHLMGSPQFVLAHSDLALQNILVSEEGAVLGIIDWDGAGAVPGCIAHYPLWLMRDWDPVMYNWDYDKNKPFYEDGPIEDTPEQLAYYRATYARYMEQYCSNSESSGHVDGIHGNIDGTVVAEPSPNTIMLRSPLFWSLAVAADDPLSLPENIVHVFDEIERVTAAGWDTPLSDLPSESTNVEGHLSGYFRPLCYTVKDLLHYIATLMRHSKAKKSLEESDIKDTNPLTGSSEPYLSGSTEPHKNRIRKKLISTLRLLREKHIYDKDVKPRTTDFERATTESRQSKNIKIQDHHIRGPMNDVLGMLPVKTEERSSEDEKRQSKLTDTCPNENIKAHCTRVQHAILGARRLFCLGKSKRSSADTEPNSVSVKACYEKDIKPRGRIRRALMKPLDLLHKKKTKGTNEGTEPRPAIFENSTNEEDKARCIKVRNTIHRAFQCLLKNKTKTPEEQKISKEVDEIVDHFWDEFKCYCKDAGLSPAQLQKACKPLEPAIDKITKNLRKEVLKASEAGGNSETDDDDYSDPNIFAQRVVTDALVDGNIRAEMMQRLREGFDALVATAV